MVKDDHLVVVDWSPSVIRAVAGVHEVIRKPTVELRARVGLRPSHLSSSTPPKHTDYLVGPALDEAEKVGEEVDIIWPLSYATSSPSSWKGTDSGQDGMEVEPAEGSGAANGKARRSREVDGIIDWVGLEVLFRYVFSSLSLPTRPYEHHILLGHPSWLPYTSLETLTSLLFERLHVTFLLLIERPVLQVFACDAVNGLVVDIGPERAEISSVNDSQIVGSRSVRLEVGEENCDDWLCYCLLEENPKLPALLSKGEAPLQGQELDASLRKICSSLKGADPPHIKFASDRLGLNISEGQGPGDQDEEEEEGLTDVAKALISGKANQIIAGKNKPKAGTTGEDKVSIPNPVSPAANPLSIGPCRHRYCEPLFDPSVLSQIPKLLPWLSEKYSPEEVERRAVTLPEAILLQVKSVDKDGKNNLVPFRTDSAGIRQDLMVWSNLVLTSTGLISRTRGLASALISSLAAFLIAPESGSDSQAKISRHLRIPEYFSEYRDQSELASALGGCIVAKIAFNDHASHLVITKQAYSEKGPSVIRVAEPVS